MIEINLLPDELKQREAGLKKLDLANLDLRSIPLIKIAIVIVVVLIAVHGLLFAVVTHGSRTLRELSKKYNEMLPNIKEAETLKARSDMMIKKVSAINELMVKRFSWAKKLNALSDSMAPGIWLTEITYDEKAGERSVTRMTAPAPVMGPPGLRERREPTPTVTTEKALLRYLVMSGCALTLGEEGAAVVGRFIKSLKDNSLFYSDIGDIELGSIKRDKIEDQEVMRFKITCAFKDQA